MKCPQCQQEIPPSADTGIGIAPEDQQAIFEEFRQVGGDDARKREGTGLGLTLSKKFVEMHGGKIWVKSQVAEGARRSSRRPPSLFGPLIGCGGRI